MKILTKEELIELTGFKQKNKIIASIIKNKTKLVKQGFNYSGATNSSGYPIVTFSESGQNKEKAAANTWHPNV
jgi:hypothetical protein